jgi:NADH-quinone oxidoreductase subunit N
MEMIIPTINFSTVYSETIIAVFAIIVLLIQAYAGSRGKGYTAYISLAGIAAAIVALFFDLSVFNSPTPEYSFGGMWVVDNFSRIFKLISLLGSGLTILISIKYVSEEGMDHGEYFALILFATLGMMIMASGADLIVIFLGIELMSIPLYVLAGYARKRQISNESALKYFLLGSFATGFLLYGIAFLYGVAGTTNLNGIAASVSNGTFQNNTLMIGMALLVVGLGFKIAVVPFHMWTPDVYQGAPSPITAFMSAGPKAVAVGAFVRIFMVALPSIRGEWVNLIWILAVLTMTTGNIFALVQDNIKRMLAYSSIAHAGYVLVAFVAAGELGLTGILYYMLAYTFMNIGAFAVITVIGGKNEEKVLVKDFTGLAWRNPVAAVLMSLFLFSLAGIPPTAGFMGKFYIFSAAIKSGYTGLAVIGVLNSVVAVYYYLRVTVAMYMKEPEEATTGAEISHIIFSPTAVIALLISAYGVLQMGILPSSYIKLIQQSYLLLQ